MSPKPNGSLMGGAEVSQSNGTHHQSNWGHMFVDREEAAGEIPI